MSEAVYLMLTAEEHNWGLRACTDWETVAWSVFSDGSYEVVTSYGSMPQLIPDSDGTGNTPYENDKRRSVGQLDDDALRSLRLILEHKSWGEDASRDGCDGTAWEIISYREDGTIDKSSGESGYIYGNEILEHLVSLLPYDASCFE